MSAAAPEVLCIGQPRLTAGLDRLRRIDLAGYETVFGGVPRLTAEQLIKMTERVDLRGRGGAGFPFARKLTAVVGAARRRKRAPVVLVNGSEGEPGSVKDSMLLLRSPYLVLCGAVIAARALRARDVLVAVTDARAARSVREAAAAESSLRRLVGVVEVPDRFVSGESSALVNAVNGRGALPSGHHGHASDSGAGSRPTLLSNAETFAQLAVLAMVGPEGYASAGTTAEPGTVLLTVGGSAARPAVVEVPTGLSLGEVLDLCAAGPADGVLVGGYHGSWLPEEVAYNVPVSRAGLAAVGGTLGAGVVLALGQDSCPLGEVAQVAAFLAKESSGQCGPCKLGLPGIARSLAALADGSGGAEALDTVRRGVLAVRGRGACSHPDGVSRFALSALDVFADDLAAHVYRGGCGRPVRNYLPLPPVPGEARLAVDWTRCRGHGLCAHIAPELIQLDRQGFPVMLDMAVPPWLERQAGQAADMCPALALRLTPAAPAPVAPAGQRRWIGRALSGGYQPDADTVPDLIVSEEWIAEILEDRHPGPAGADGLGAGGSGAPSQPRRAGPWRTSRHQARMAKTRPSAARAIMFISHWCPVWSHRWSIGFPGAGGKILLRFEVEAVSAYPQRDGDSHETCSRPTLPAIANTPPVRMTSTTTTTIRIGMVFSDVLTDAEMNRPSAMDTTASRASAMISSSSGNPWRSDPLTGSFRPIRPINTMTAACTPLMNPRTASLDPR
jgi:NADH:ubiquinone oxidoreductase subunit F (NADH-binding)/ferredoxin